MYDDLEKAYEYFPNPKKLRVEERNGDLNKRPAVPVQEAQTIASKRKKSK